MALMGAELLFYPTAIGSEPYDTNLDTSRMWRRAMQGHAVSHCMPVIAANRIGREGDADFYGHSFITDEWGDLTQQFGRAESGVLIETIDLERAARNRDSKTGRAACRERGLQYVDNTGVEVSLKK